MLSAIMSVLICVGEGILTCPELELELGNSSVLRGPSPSHLLLRLWEQIKEKRASLVGRKHGLASRWHVCVLQFLRALSTGDWLLTPSAGYFPRACSGQGSAGLKLGAENLTWVCHPGEYSVLPAASQALH